MVAMTLHSDLAPRLEPDGSWSLRPEHDRVLVTGGGSGIGRALTLALAGMGVTTYILGRTEATLVETARLAEDLPGRIVPIRCDLRDETDADAAFERIEDDGGPVQSLAHCAASVYTASARAITVDGFRKVVDSTLVAAFITISRFARPLLDSKVGGTVVSLTSNSASAGAAGVAHSGAGKAGLESLTMTLAREWGPSGIRINAIGPGPFPVENSVEGLTRPAVLEHLQRTTPLGRLGRIEEVVGPILFFLSPLSGYTSGQVLVCDGGRRTLDWVIPPDLQPPDWR